jgi:hypothetical protein
MCRLEGKIAVITDKTETVLTEYNNYFVSKG